MHNIAYSGRPVLGLPNLRCIYGCFGICNVMTCPKQPLPDVLRQLRNLHRSYLSGHPVDPEVDLDL